MTAATEQTEQLIYGDLEEAVAEDIFRSNTPGVDWEQAVKMFWAEKGITSSDDQQLSS